MLPHRIFLASILALALLTAGCGEIVTRYGEVMVVEGALLEKFGDQVYTTANPGDQGVMFTVWFINSSFNEKSAQERLMRASEAAKVVKGTYPRIQNVSELWIGFLRAKARFVVFNNSEIVSVHGFDKHASPLPGRNDVQAPSPTGIEVNTYYDSRAKQSDISVTGLQLEGEPGGLGVTILPFFVLHGGDVRKGVKLPPPHQVEVNFASYSKKPRFRQTVPITFVADGKLVLKTEGSFVGNDAQFCYLKIPYSAFDRMVSGKELIIKLGDKEYSLTPSQIEAMKRMTEYVQK